MTKVSKLCESLLAVGFARDGNAGETLTILHDKSRHAHPEFDSMSRRPDRDLRQRASENWFPYELLNIEPTGEGDRLRMQDRFDLVRYQDELVPIAEIGDLEPESMVWLGFILDLIAKKYGGDNPRLESSLSYTVEMIRKPNALVPAESSLIVQNKYKPLELPIIKASELTAETAFVAAQFEKKAYGHNRHVFERFKHLVTDEAINLIGNEEKKLLRESNSDLSEVEKDSWGKVVGHKIPLKTFSPLTFGTPAEIERDRYWYARYNQMSIIRHAAQKEFNEKRAEICEWFETRVRANRDNLLNYVAAMECQVEVGLWKSDYSYRYEQEKKLSKEKGKPVYLTSFPMNDELVATKFKNILTVRTLNNKSSVWHQTRTENGCVWFGRWADYPYRYICYSDDWTRASIVAWFKPTESSHLAILANCDIEDLPEQIRFWNKSKPYVGNSILDRIDPEDWILDDYFKKLDFQVTFTVCKTAFNDLRKESGFPRIDWSKVKIKDQYD